MTAQAHEKLILEGVEVSMAFCPALPIDAGQVTETSASTLRQRIGSKEWPSFLQSTACWRRYIATWEIKEGRLYLNQVIGRYHKPDPAPLFADWVTAVLRVPEGKRIQLVNMGFGSVWETELHIKVERGVVLKQRRVDNTGRTFDRSKLGFLNLPGGENRFDGDDF